MDLEENLKFIKKEGAELSDEKYIFLGCNASYVIAVSTGGVVFYCRSSLRAVRRLRAKRSFVAADLHRNVLVLVSPGELHSICTQSMQSTSFSIPGITNVSISEKHLLVQKGGAVLVFARDSSGEFALESSVENVLRIGKGLVVCADQVLNLNAPEEHMSVQNSGDVLGVVECSNRIIVTNTHFVTKKKAIAHGMGADVLWTTFDVFTVFIRKSDTMFVLVGEDELELDEDATMVRCRQEGGTPMGVLFLFSICDRLYFLDSGCYLNVYAVEGVETKKEEEHAPLPVLGIQHTESAVSRQATEFSAVFEEQGVAAPSGEQQREQQDTERKSRSIDVSESKSPKPKSPQSAVLPGLREIVDKVRSIRIRGHHIKLFKYYESTDLYEKNAELYEKIQKAAAIINDIECGVFEKNLLSDIETIRCRAEETERVEESMVQANILYIDSKILKGAGFRRPVHYTSPLVARNTYAMHYEDQPPLRTQEGEESGLLEVFETMSFGKSDERGTVDLQNLDISGLTIGPAPEPEPLPKSGADAFLATAPAREEAREVVFAAPTPASAEAAPVPETPVVQAEGGQSTMYSIFGQPAESGNVFGGLFQSGSDAAFKPEAAQFPGLQSTTNLFSQAVQSGPFSAPGPAAWAAKDEKKNKSALSKLSSQMGSFFGNTQ